MALSSTDDLLNNSKNGYSNGNRLCLLPNYPVLSVTTGPNNSWLNDISSNSSISPFSDQNWDIDEEEIIKRRIYEIKRQFHNGRFLIFRNLPKNTTEEDIRSLLQDTLVHSVQINDSNGSARVLLVEPEVLETWAKSTQKVLNNHTVTISPSNSENLLCVAKLPLGFSEEGFQNLAASFGDLNYCFLMRSEKTGESKGYGFIEYVNKEVSHQAKLALDGKQILESYLACDWLNPSHITFASLHSSTLYVDHLPKDYRNMGEFREIFSKVSNPPYCQIAILQGAVQNWGLVEFSTPEDAEETLTLVNGYKIQGASIRVSYYIPGIRAINIYTKLLNAPTLHSKGAPLLPEPPTNKVFNQLKNLTKQNPAFAKSLQNIILTQIQALQQNSPTTQSPVETNGTVLRKTVNIPPHISLPPRIPPPHTHNHAPLPIPVHLQHAFPVPVSYHHPTMPTQPIMVPSQSSIDLDKPNSLNSNAQAALLILLAAQLQQQQETNTIGAVNGAVNNSVTGYVDATTSGISTSPTNSNILSNPQVLNLLQNLVSQGDPHQYSEASCASNASHVTHAGPNRPLPYGMSPTCQASNNAPPNLSASLKANFHNGYFKNGSNKPRKAPLLPTPPPSSSASYPSLNVGENNHSEDPCIGRVAPVLSDLLGSSQDDLPSSISSLLSNTQSLQHLLGALNNHESNQAPVYTKPPPVLGSYPAGHLGPPCTPVPQSQALVTRPPLYQAPEHVMPVLLRPPESLPTERFIAPPQYHIFPGPPPVNAVRGPPHAHPHGPVLAWTETCPQNQPPTPVIQPQLFQQPATQIPPAIYNQAMFLTPTSVAVSGASSMIAPPFNASSMPPTGFRTPPTGGQKRKSSQFLASPEPSPENGYIGQHSQGIGGHYADSYIPKKFKRH